jgi:hypothetical protein
VATLLEPESSAPVWCKYRCRGCSEFALTVRTRSGLHSAPSRAKPSRLFHAAIIFTLASSGEDGTDPPTRTDRQIDDGCGFHRKTQKSGSSLLKHETGQVVPGGSKDFRPGRARRQLSRPAPRQCRATVGVRSRMVGSPQMTSTVICRWYSWLIVMAKTTDPGSDCDVPATTAGSRTEAKATSNSKVDAGINHHFPLFTYKANTSTARNPPQQPSVDTILRLRRVAASSDTPLLFARPQVPGSVHQLRL